MVLIQVSGENVRFEVFDAKYRTARKAVLDAMTSAHIYHDALRFNGRRPDSALLVLPNIRNAGPLSDAGFRQQHGVGVIELSE